MAISTAEQQVGDDVVGGVLRRRQQPAHDVDDHKPDADEEQGHAQKARSWPRRWSEGSATETLTTSSCERPQRTPGRRLPLKCVAAESAPGKRRVTRHGPPHSTTSNLSPSTPLLPSARQHAGPRPLRGVIGTARPSSMRTVEERRYAEQAEAAHSDRGRADASLDDAVPRPHSGELLHETVEMLALVACHERQPDPALPSRRRRASARRGRGSSDGTARRRSPPPSRRHR